MNKSQKIIVIAYVATCIVVSVGSILFNKKMAKTYEKACLSNKEEA